MTKKELAMEEKILKAKELLKELECLKLNEMGFNRNDGGGTPRQVIALRYISTIISDLLQYIDGAGIES